MIFGGAATGIMPTYAVEYFISMFASIIQLFFASNVAITLAQMPFMTKPGHRVAHFKNSSYIQYFDVFHVLYTRWNLEIGVYILYVFS